MCLLHPAGDPWGRWLVGWPERPPQPDWLSWRLFPTQCRSDSRWLHKNSSNRLNLYFFQGLVCKILVAAILVQQGLWSNVFYFLPGRWNQSGLFILFLSVYGCNPPPLPQSLISNKINAIILWIPQDSFGEKKINKTLKNQINEQKYKLQTKPCVCFSLLLTRWFYL